MSEEDHYEPISDHSFTATIQKLERDNQQIQLEFKEFQAKAQAELLDAEQNVLLWKAAAESYELKLNEMKETIPPALDTLALHLSTYFGSEKSE
ncbi:hypothetical protein SI65_00602 [Aspergillus cristatus]|uniref:Uncharacterized protein n=1 Tax=Aspergillus cristatus TaxID=573508 RepID=A0A1E3BPW0_ASPCR|nr:hypothetical protein SI65_00602 [Aspergillus cristatus]